MTSNSIQFSVIIPLYNKERYVARCIQSVLAQTRQDFEIIVVNDGSTDHGPDIVRQMTDSRIRYFHKENGGVSSARNLGAREALSGLLLFLDADDELLPHYLEAVAELAEKYPKAGAYGTACWFVKANGWIRYGGNKGPLEGKYEGIVTNFFRGGHILWYVCGVIRKEVFERVGPFDLRLTNGQDADMRFRLAVESSFAYTEDPQIIWHIGIPNSLSQAGLQSFRADKVLSNHDKYLALSLPEELKSNIREYTRRSLISALTVSSARGFPDYTRELFEDYKKRFGYGVQARLWRLVFRWPALCRVLLNRRRVGTLLGRVL